MISARCRTVRAAQLPLKIRTVTNEPNPNYRRLAFSLKIAAFRAINAA